MAPTCGICQQEASKYKCPKCELRYCSLACYRQHKPSHPEATASEATTNFTTQPHDRPGTTQRIAKPTFAAFESDPELLRLSMRYPNLKAQLGAVYAMTLEPGPEDERNWNKPPFRRGSYHLSRGRGLGRASFRGSRGRAASRAAGLGAGSGKRWFDADDENRQRGPWTRQKGDKEGVRILKNARSGADDDSKLEGIKEFIELCQMRFRQTGA